MEASVAHSRAVPANKPLQAGVFIHTSKVGELVQKFIDDPSVIGVEIEVTSTHAMNNEWFVKPTFAVLDLVKLRLEIENRLRALTGDNPTFRVIPDK